jgi:ABC-type sugar transport system ATPase subunit
MGSLALRGLAKSFDGVEVLHPMDLEVPHGEFLVLVGPSGCGKTTLLRMIAGLEDVTRGTIAIDGRVVNELEPKDRDVAMVFQDYALYPHMSAYDNIAFGLIYRGYDKAEIRRRVAEAAEILGVTQYLRRRPRQLSGGQRQRVAMGRAIVRNPKVFLFDEPLSNLDAQLRVQMRTEIKKLHQKVATTVVYVTHDQVEAMTLADRIVVMRAGQVEQIGTPEQVYEQPASIFVAGFIGAPMMNLVPARVTADGGACPLALEDGVRLPGPPGLEIGRSFTVGLRPEHFEWRPGATGPGSLQVTARVIEPLGADTLVFFELGGREAVCRVPPRTVRRPGEGLTLFVDAVRLHLFDPATERAIRPAPSAGRVAGDGAAMIPLRVPGDDAG